uniref:Beta-glucuronidase C-terminal domain-containing protein n=1 Tax=Moniliophthora roreri TaxID=221103 RepID=A0A0W0FRR1_MONRR
MKFFRPIIYMSLLFDAVRGVLNDGVLKLQGPASLPDTASHPLHPSLASFSIETAFFITYVGNVTHPNLLTKNLLENLKERTGRPAEIRIGGITADSTYWDPSLEAAAFNFITDDGVLHNTTIGPGFWDAVRELLPEGTEITMNLNLHDLNYRGALEVAQSASEGLNPGQLVALEIGNEPDHYLSFTPQNYSEIWTLWSKDISTALNFSNPMFQVAATAEDPLWPYDAPGATQQLGCVSALRAGVNNASTVKLCSEHTYQYSVCDPPRIAVATLPNLVNHTRLAMYLDLWQPRIKFVRDELGPDSYLIGEYSSVSCSGRNGVSNTFGQALWLLDTTFYGASLNVSRQDVYASRRSTCIAKLYTAQPWWTESLQYVVSCRQPERSKTLGHSKTMRIANIYPGRQANGSTITAGGGDTSAGQLVAYGFWDTSTPSGTAFPVKFALLNLQIFNQTSNYTRPSAIFDISLFLPEQNTSVIVRHMQAPGADVKAGNLTTWAGQTFASGSAKGEVVEECVNDGKVTVEASGAALVIMNRKSEMNSAACS